MANEYEAKFLIEKYMGKEEEDNLAVTEDLYGMKENHCTVEESLINVIIIIIIIVIRWGIKKNHSSVKF